MEKYPLLCRYYMNGCCTEGDDCLFSHDWNSKPDMVCRYYLKGCCAYGANCRHDHIKPSDVASSLSSRGEMPAPVTLPSIKRQKELDEEEHQQMMNNKPSLTVLSAAKLPDNWEELTAPFRPPENWVEAPEFVPGSSQHVTISKPKEEFILPPEIASYSEAAKTGTEAEFIDKITPDIAALLLCPFAAKGFCPFGEECEYLHGLVCDLCGCECLHPYDITQQQEHRKECVNNHEKEMEKAFAAQRSEGMTCSICMEVVLSKNPPSEQRFGILTDCEHAFCLNCIRQWRSSTHTKKATIRACPICRKVSYFVIPSSVWITDQAEKERLISDFKKNTRAKPCRHFQQGNGVCPFGNICFYSHAMPDGVEAEVDLRLYKNAENETKLLTENKLWDFITVRENSSSNLVTDEWNQ